MQKAALAAIIREKFIALASLMDERTRRLWAATEAKALGHGGPTLVARATGLSSRGVPCISIYTNWRPMPHRHWPLVRGCAAVVGAARR